jgi:ubiquinone/menaquinone biosynthesis C-methylase UbiE
MKCINTPRSLVVPLQKLFSTSLSDKEKMLMNWPERVWIYSPIRVFFQIREIRKWLKLVGRIPAENALEIGCGLGRGARLLVKEMGFRNVAAFDLEERLIVRAVKSNPENLKEKVSFYVGDAQDLPFPAESFDAVVNFGIIHHVLDWRKCISEVSRVLRLGGLFYFEEIYPPLYANFLMKYLVRHPTEDRFNDQQFLEALDSQDLSLVEGVQRKSRFGIVGVARKKQR